MTAGVLDEVLQLLCLAVQRLADRDNHTAFITALLRKWEETASRAWNSGDDSGRLALVAVLKIRDDLAIRRDQYALSADLNKRGLELSRPSEHSFISFALGGCHALLELNRVDVAIAELTRQLVVAMSHGATAVELRTALTFIVNRFRDVDLQQIDKDPIGQLAKTAGILSESFDQLWLEDRRKAIETVRDRLQ